MGNFYPGVNAIFMQRVYKTFTIILSHFELSVVH